MWIRSLGLAIALAAAVVSCDSFSPGSNGVLPGKTEKALLEKAQQLAESELARLSAAEMIYRNKVYDHVYIDEDNGVRTDILMKYYRNFRHAEVMDVRRTDSLLRPVEFVIRFDFDTVGTRGEAGLPTTMVESAKIVKNDTSFKVYAADSFIREYRCDAAGNCDNIDLSMLPRPNYWDMNPWASKNGVLQIEDMTLLGGS